MSETDDRAAMTVPTPEQMRALADAAANLTVDNDWDATVIADVLTTLRAAADEVDRLRAELVEAQADAENGWKVAEQWERTASDVKAADDVFLDERNGLRASIENAPHREHCRPNIACICWKADVL